jgi:hypothetical protein
MKRIIWTIVFLGGTVAVVIEEIWAGFDKSDNTVPWTDYIVTYIPEPVMWALVGLLITWLPVHLYVYRQKRKKA